MVQSHVCLDHCSTHSTTLPETGSPFEIPTTQNILQDV